MGRDSLARPRSSAFHPPGLAGAPLQLRHPKIPRVQVNEERLDENAPQRETRPGTTAAIESAGAGAELLPLQSSPPLPPDELAFDPPDLPFETTLLSMNDYQEGLPGASCTPGSSAATVLGLHLASTAASCWCNSTPKSPVGVPPAPQSALPDLPPSLKKDFDTLPDGADTSEEESGPAVSRTWLMPEAELDDVNLVPAFHLGCPCQCRSPQSNTRLRPACTCLITLL